MVHPRLKVKYQGKLLSVPEAARAIGISTTALWFRLERGWPKEKLLSPERHVRGGGISPVRLAIAGRIGAEEYLKLEGNGAH